MRGIALAVMLLGLPGTAAGQGFELGGSISRGCTGDSSGFCGPETGAMWGVHGGFWLSPRVEIAIRFARLPLGDSHYSTMRDDRFNLADDPAARMLPRIDMTSTARRRQLIGAEFLYHFARDGGFGAVLGGGIGEARNSGRLACMPAGCERVLSALGSAAGDWATRVNNVTIVAGLSGRVADRLRLTGGVRLHNFAGEELSTSEAFFAAGVLFGKF